MTFCPSRKARKIAYSATTVLPLEVGELTHLAGRHLELLPHAAQKAADDLALGFQRSAFGQVQHDAHRPDGQVGSHPSVRLGVVPTRSLEVDELGREIVKASYLKGDFVLRSGKHSNRYFDKFLFETDPALLRRVGKHLAELVPADTQLLAAPELGAVRLGGAVSRQMGRALVLEREGAEGYWTARQSR